MNQKITATMLKDYVDSLILDEKSDNTVKKYKRDVKAFIQYTDKKGKEGITKELVIGYKSYLGEHYQLRSANSMLAAVNSFLRWGGWNDCTVKVFKIQRDSFRPTDKELTIEEYKQLLEVARSKNQLWLYYILMTVCATGIRISELKYVTVESLFTRHATVRSKGKSRTIILPADLCRKLQAYCREQKIEKGSVFVTRSGNAIDRSNVHHAMKKLGLKVNIEPNKIYPHNLRHLFAVQYYETFHDISGLSDILGHASLNTTRIYTMVSIEKKEMEVNLLKLVV